MKLLFILLVTSLLLSIFAVAKQDKQISKYQQQSVSLKMENDSLHRMYDSARAALRFQQSLTLDFDTSLFSWGKKSISTVLGGYRNQNSK